MRLIEPLGLLAGPVADDAVRAGLARWLAGGPLAFTLVRLLAHRPGASVTAVRSVSLDWQDVLARICAPVPPWAGLPPDRPAVMGILNVTPDSFSDGGAHGDADHAIAAGMAMWDAGADIVDVGGESTRPGAPPLDPQLERARVLPVVRGLAERGVRVSIDARNAATMAAALAAGASIVNDISGLSYDPASASVVARWRCPVVLMHMRGVPTTMVQEARYTDVAAEVTAELAGRVAAAARAGIAAEMIAVDPGIGFAKTGEHNLELLARLPVLCNLGRRILVGLSRKSFVGRMLGGAAPRDRDGASVLLGLGALGAGASILRVHDVAGTIAAIRLQRAAVG